MATLTAVKAARSANLFAAVAAAAGGDDFVNDGKKLLVIEHTNGAGADMTLTIATPMTVDGEDVGEKAIAVVKGTRQLLGPFPKSIYNDGDAKVALTYSSETDVEVSVIDIS